jgi:hypothetical protein
MGFDSKFGGYRVVRVQQTKHLNAESSCETSSVKRKTKLGPATVVRHKQGV